MTVSSLPKHDKKSSRHRVKEKIEALILTGKMKPGERLVQEKLAQKFRVAQGVVRESLLELSCCGLVEAVDNFGVFVSELDSRQALEALEIREVLEGLAARLCCRKVSRDDIDQLHSMVAEIHSLGREGKQKEAALLDRDFHQRIVAISQNGTLQAVTESHWTLRLILKMTSDVEIVHEAHEAIVTAIEHNRPDEAEEAMREHVRSAKKHVEQQIADGGFKPEWLF